MEVSSPAELRTLRRALGKEEFARLAANGKLRDLLAGSTGKAREDAFGELAAYRVGEAMPVAGTPQDVSTAARLSIDGQAFNGKNAHRTPIDIKVNAQTRTHAEAHVFQLAKNAATTGETATIFVDRCVLRGELRARILDAGHRRQVPDRGVARGTSPDHRGPALHTDLPRTVTKGPITKETVGDGDEERGR